MRMAIASDRDAHEPAVVLANAFKLTMDEMEVLTAEDIVCACLTVLVNTVISAPNQKWRRRMAQMIEKITHQAMAEVTHAAAHIHETAGHTQ